jgi:hypothetical protein
MKLSERIAKSEAHVYLTRLYARGWKKKSNQTFRGGNIVRLERETARGLEIMHVKFCDNGWVSFY